MVESLERGAEKLPAADRLRLVEHILTSFDQPDPAIDAAWAAQGRTQAGGLCPGRDHGARRGGRVRQAPDLTGDLYCDAQRGNQGYNRNDCRNNSCDLRNDFKGNREIQMSLQTSDQA